MAKSKATAGDVTSLALPDPEHSTLPVIRAQCRQIYDRRDEVIGVFDLQRADHFRRGAGAIEQFIGNREGRDDAQRSARVLECAVGAALGKPEKGGRGKKVSLASDSILDQDRVRFRLMFQHRNLWEPELQKHGLSRSKVLKTIHLELRRRQALTDSVENHTDDDCGVLHGNFVEIAEALRDSSVPFIFTDPPYHDDTLGLYRDLGTVASRVLPIGGSLITYTSHHRMPEVIGMLQDAGLTFFWPLAMVHTGQKARMTEYGIVVCWKPLLWFVKGKFRSRENMTFVDDLVMSEQQKGTHVWQQSTMEASYYIQALTVPNEIVFDPFCGGGTTAVAAKQTNRRWLTCDVDEETVWIARQRLREVVV